MNSRRVHTIDDGFHINEVHGEVVAPFLALFGLNAPRRGDP
jgi:hypothetical protein